jgi:choline dehydrogenase-like flavoprotein
VTVDRILISAARVTGIEARIPGPDGSSRILRVRANQVVMAAGALRTPGVLANSSVGHSALGRFLRIQPVAALVGRFEEPIEMWRGTMQAARSLAFAPGTGGGSGGFTIESVPAHPGLLASAIPWGSAAAHARRMAQAAHLAPLIAISRDRDWGRVTPLRSGRARVDYRLTGADVGQLREGLVQMARIMAAAGAAEVIAPGLVEHRWAATEGDGAFRAYLAKAASHDFRPNIGAVFSAHQMGTARMGGEPGTHVCDPRGRVRWAVAGIGGDQVIRGLYVADSSLFPTALGVNPMLTVMLLARRVARTVLAEATAGS